MSDIKKLLELMVEHDASDLYLTVSKPPCYKINGVVRPAGKQILSAADTERLAKSVMDEEQFNVFQEKKEQNLALYYPEIGRFRVNCYRQKSYAAMVIRKIETNIQSIDDLKLPAVLKPIVMTKRGLILIVGATGSGKSTSLAAMIDHRNSNEAGHIMTIEDPVEFVHEHKQSVVSQREVGVDTDSFKDALKNALRQAPNVILIGEIRDEETMEHAMNFAETGHLCLATLHSNNANQALERVLNFFPPERHRQMYLQLSLNLKAIISQRLVKTSDGGRAAAIEILLDSPRVKDLIKKGEVDAIKGAMVDGAVDGMQTFDQAFFSLYKQGRITLEEALDNADSATDLKLKIKLDTVKEEQQQKREEKEQAREEGQPVGQVSDASGEESATEEESSSESESGGLELC